MPTITIMTGGTRGDVQPYVALGAGLQAAGYTVRIAASDNFAGLVTDAGLTFVSTGESIEALLNSPPWRATLERGNFVTILRQMQREMRSRAAQQARQIPTIIHGSDLLIAGMAGFGGAFTAALAAQIPILIAHLVPFTPTRRFPSPLIPVATLGGMLNRLSFRVMQLVFWQTLHAADAATRTTLGLPAAPLGGPFGQYERQQIPVMYGYSPHVLPRPNDWPPQHVVTGYWFLDPPLGWIPPADLVAFLAAGPPPIYLGFGSMGGRNPEAAGRMALEALAQTGQRGILAAGWGGLTVRDVPPTVHLLEAIPHAWLFPHLAGIVHHGGAGTTAAALRAGVPSIVVPFMGDQAFWGKRVAELGVGPPPIARTSLRSVQLGHAIERVVRDAAMQQRAAVLGQQIDGDRGIPAAVAIVQRLVPVP